MGLFDAFGVGGGKLAIKPDATTVAAGSALRGTVVFTSGKRSQKITNIKARLTCSVTSLEPGPNGMEKRTNAQPLVPEAIVTGAFATTPGQAHSFPFAFEIPAAARNTTPQQVDYRLSASADIDGEVDPGASLEVVITGGAAVAPMAMAMGARPGMPGPGMMNPGMPGPGMMNPGMAGPGMAGPGMAGPGMAGPGMAGPGMGGPGMMNQGMVGPGMGGPGMMNQGMAGPGMGGPGMMNQGMAGPGMGGPGMAVAPIGVGSAVTGQWSDGNWYPGRVVQVMNGMYGVDWDNPALGASTWLAAHQVQAAAAMGMAGPGMPVAAPKAPVMVGSRVLAQWSDGGWYPGQVVQVANGMFGVDWENPALGASTWVAAHQVVPA